VGSFASTASGPHLSEAEKASLLAQLDRILESSWFRTSQRSSALIRHLVMETLSGRSDELRQRPIAIKVFHRASAFDADADPVVRIAAGDARKRLAQYYDVPEHDGEIRIELPIGSYVPVFRFPNIESVVDKRPEPDLSISIVEEPPISVDASVNSAKIDNQDPNQESHHRSRHRWKKTTLIIAFSALPIALGAWFAVRSVRPTPGFDDFWAPVVSAQTQPLISVGDFLTAQMEFAPNGQRNPNPDSIGGTWKFGENPKFPHSIRALTFDNAVAASRVAITLATKHRFSELRSEADTSFVDLSSRPVILIGSYDNDWIIRITDKMRFRYQNDTAHHLQWIQDREKPAEKIGLRFADSWPSPTAEDFCIVVRSTDPSTGQIVVIVSGLTYMSTTAASQFASDPKFLNDFARGAPKDWARKNVEFLIASNRVDGGIGQPRIVAYTLW
jgi:hypothetical protein